MYPGQPYGWGDLLTAFAGQFYRNWGVIAYQVAAGLLLAALFTFLCKILWVNRLRESIGKKIAMWGLPAFWALVFLGCQVWLAFSNQTSYWGLKDYKLGRILMKTERLMMDGRYEEALRLANKYWFSHPCSINDVVTGRHSLYAELSPTEILFRTDLAAYTRVALLGAHRLNEDFFSYYRIPEIYGQIEEAGTPASLLIPVFRNRLTGNHTAVYSQLMNVMETEGMSYWLLEQSVFSALVCRQYGLANQYIRLLENTLFYRKDALLYRQVSEYLQNPRTAAASSETRALAEQIERERNKSLTDYIYTSGSGEAEARELWRQRPAASLENLEYLALADLLYKRTDRVMARIGDYLRLSAQDRPPYRLPAAWQEMLLVMAEEHPGQLPPEVAQYMRHLAWNDMLVKQTRLFYRERERLRQGLSSPQQITQRFGHTFAYNYYYSRFVNPPQNGPLSFTH